MPNVKLVVNPINVTNSVIIRVEKVSAPGVEITRQTFAAPHSQRNITFPDLDAVVYTFFFWESIDGVALTTLLGSADIDAAKAGEGYFQHFFLTVDGPGDNDPVSGTDEIEIEDLDGVLLAVSGEAATTPVCQIIQRGVGPKERGVEVEDFDPDNGRGFRLLQGDLFNQGDRWVVNVFRKIEAAAGGGGSAGGYPGSFEDIAESISLDITHLQKTLQFSGSDPVQLIPLMDLAGVADGKFMVFNTHKFTGNYVKLDFSAGGSLAFAGEELAAFYMPPGEELAVMFYDGIARVISYQGNAKTRGRIVWDYKERPGYIVADGQELSNANYPGLYEFVENLPVGVACSYADWALATTLNSGLVDEKVVYYNTSRWAIDTGAETIKVPDARDRFVRGLKLQADATRPSNVPGGYQVDQVGNFRATPKMTKGENYSGGPNNTIIGNGNNNSAAVNLVAAQFNTGNAQTLVGNIGLIPLITL
jgi:hypothetical protein